MKRISILFLLFANCSSLFAHDAVIDGIAYYLNKDNMTAEVTYRTIQLYPYPPFPYKESNIDIPSYVQYKGKTYTVTSIGPATFKDNGNVISVTLPKTIINIGSQAFCECKKISSINLPDSLTTIGSEAFKGCINLSSINISKNVRSIGSGAFINCLNLSYVVIPENLRRINDHLFMGCKKLNQIVIPNSVNSIGYGVFQDCERLVIYSALNESIKYEHTNLPNLSKIVKINQEDLPYYLPFSIYAKQYVEDGINTWQRKDEFERTIDWQQRVTEQTRREQIKSLLAEAEKKYIAFHAQGKNSTLELGKYDADNEVFAIKDSNYGNIYMAVPIGEAKAFKSDWNNKSVSRQLQINDDKIILSTLTIALQNGKEYSYKTTDAVNYNLAEVEYNFDPIELNISQQKTDKPGERNISTKKITLGMSNVDSDIPKTDASSPNTFAIIFANENYKNVASVPFAKNDGTIFQKYCQKTLGIPASNIHYVENASYNDIRIQLAWLKDVCDAYEGNASVLVYYAGHGIPDEGTKSAYLLPVDGDGRYVQSAYKLDDMYQKLGAMNTKSVTVFMDACFSGSKRENGMLASARGVAIKAKSGVPQGNMVVFTAAQGDETAYPNNDEQHGIFTYYLLKKLQETKGDVTLLDLGDYITTNVRQQSIVKNGKPQTPCVIPSASLGTEWQSWKLK